MNTEKKSRLNGMLLLAAVLFGVSACGFHLREPVRLPESLQVISVQGGSIELRRELIGQLSSSATVVDEQSQAQAVLQILSEKQSRRTLTTDSRGKVKEGELHYAVSFQVRDAQDNIRLEESQVSLIRDYLNDESVVLGQSNEAAVLLDEMKREAAQRIVQRLQAIH